MRFTSAQIFGDGVPDFLLKIIPFTTNIATINNEIFWGHYVRDCLCKMKGTNLPMLHLHYVLLPLEISGDSSKFCLLPLTQHFYGLFPKRFALRFGHTSKFAKRGIRAGGRRTPKTWSCCRGQPKLWWFNGIWWDLYNETAAIYGAILPNNRSRISFGFQGFS